MDALVAGVDVGTGSVRAGLFDRTGEIRGRGESPIDLYHPAPGHAEQNSEQIWAAVAQALHAARMDAAAPPSAVQALAFDATCSLVLRRADGAPLVLSADAGGGWDTIAWLDHRARAQAAAISATGHPVLDYAGGVLSPEMQLPKLKWLKENAPGHWAELGLAFDLADYLGWRATGINARSQCTLGCKWGYLAHEAQGWPHDFHAAIGLEDLIPRTGLPQRARPVAQMLGPLTASAAAALDLPVGLPVAVGMIDAHAGALAALAPYAEQPEALASQAALVAGTSSCVMSFSETPQTAPGLWGPCYGAGFPGLWLREGGQTASGGLLDHLCHLWTGARPTPALHHQICTRIAALQEGDGWALAGQMYVLPDFQGNRTPFGAAEALGVISGLDLDRSFDGLCRVYWRTAVALALGIAQITRHMATHGPGAAALHLVGGHAHSQLLPPLYAAATGGPVHCPQTPNAMLLGSAMVAATAIGWFPSLPRAARAMARPAATHLPDPGLQTRLRHDRAVMELMQDQRAALRGLNP